MAVAARAPGDYAPLAGGRAVEALQEAAAPLRGARVLHVSAAGAPGPVPELLGGMLPVAAGAGVAVEWRVLFADPDLRRVGSSLEHGLRGGESAIAADEWDAWAGACERIGRSLNGMADLVVLHDPGTLGLAAGLDVPVAWRCHLDASRAEPEALDRVMGALEACRLTLVPHQSFAPEPLRDERLLAAPPGIDPLDSRNLDLEPRLPGRVVRPLGVDLERPFVLQVVQLDRWDDPHAAIDAFRLAKAEEPDLQLVLAGLLDPSAAEDWRAAKEVSDFAAGEADVLLLTTYEGLGSLEVGALQRLARAALELSLREGFDLAPCETLWKRTPVVGRADGGLRLTVRDSVDGFLAADPEQLAARLVELVRDPGLAVEMGRAGRERVRERFLVTAALERELRALAALRAGAPAPGSVEDQ
ncbi:MAG: trehalose synthase [Thermoleophilaceae bacterium]|nr:trehalose synthase [Thermoleophilaceae bacterium]